MKSTARIANHPIHPMLVLLPAGAFIIVLLCDVLYMVTNDPLWWDATRPVLLLGIAGALLAAVPGFIDLFTVVPRQSAKTLGIAHMILNLAAVGIFAWNALLRWGAAPPASDLYFEFWLTLIGNALIAVSGWLGGSMVYEYHVGVLEHPEAKDPGARA